MWPCIVTIRSCDRASWQYVHVTLHRDNTFMWPCIVTIRSCDRASWQYVHVTVHRDSTFMWPCIVTVRSCDRASWLRSCDRASWQYVHVTVHRDNTFMWQCIVTNLFLIEPTDALIPQIYFVKKFYWFRALPLPNIRSFPLYIRHWYMSCRFDDVYQCRMYSGKLLMMGRGTARNMYSFLTK
jgi:hypothetical protein